MMKSISRRLENEDQNVCIGPEQLPYGTAFNGKDNRVRNSDLVCDGCFGEPFLMCLAKDFITCIRKY
jgi:hypothetical protein